MSLSEFQHWGASLLLLFSVSFFLIEIVNDAVVTELTLVSTFYR